MRSSNKPLLIVLVLYLVGVGFAVTFSVIAFPGDQVHAAFTNSYILNSAVETFFRYQFAFHGAALLLAFSLFVSPGDFRGSSSLFDAARSTVVVVVFLGLLYTLGVTWLRPAALDQRERLEQWTILADELYRDAELYEESRQFSRAAAALEGYARLVGAREETEVRLENLRSRAAEGAMAREGAQASGETVLLRSDIQELGPAELITLARQYFDEGEYYSAHYYAELAVRMSDGTRPDAQRLSARAWERITSYALSTAEQSDSDFFRRKRAAYEAFQAGQQSEESLIDAYYRLRALHEERPGDPDVDRYLELAQAQLKEISFFIEDAEAQRANAGFRSILVINDRSATEWELLRVGKMVRHEGIEYLYDLEGVRYDGAGAVRFHFTAPYGKIIGRTINMQAISRDSAQVREMPQYFAGSAPGEISFIFDLSFTPEELATAASGVEERDQAHIGKLIGLRGLAERIGLPRTPLDLELFMRLGNPLLFIALSFLCMGFGWSLRSHYVMRPPAVALLFLPLLPVAAHLALVLLSYLFRILSASLLVSISFLWSAVAIGAIAFILLLLSLYSVARQSTS